MTVSPTLDCPCDGKYLEPSFTYDAPPAGETKFHLPDYRRSYQRCRQCGHWFGRHDMDLSAFYSGDYASQTYPQGLGPAFARIMALPPEKSDNVQRVARINAHMAQLRPDSARRVLDVGGGLGVFVARMKESGWQCVHLDPDPRSAAHARETIGVSAVAGDFMTVDVRDVGPVDLITLNKVLEHVERPVDMLRRCRDLVAPPGLVYVEVPDGEAAAQISPERQEFHLEHIHVFTMNSLTLMVERAGFRALVGEAIHEPSGKYSLWALAEPTHS